MEYRFAVYSHYNTLIITKLANKKIIQDKFELGGFEFQFLISNFTGNYIKVKKNVSYLTKHTG